MSEKEQDTNEATIEDARKLLEQERDDRLRRCHALIQQALKETGCQIVAQPQLAQDGRLGAVVQIVVNEGG